MAQIGRETNKISARKGSSVSEAASQFAEVETTFAKRWALWTQLLVLQFAVIGGIFLASAAQDSSGGWHAFSNGYWQFLLLALATMSVGFGGATLLYQRLADGQSDQLEEDYRSLTARANSLLKSSLQSESGPRASRSDTAAPTAARGADPADLDHQGVPTPRSTRDAVYDAALDAASLALKSVKATPDAELDVSRTHHENGSHLAERAGRILFEAIEQNPWLLAGVGLVIGGLIASALPDSDFEDEPVKRRGRATASPQANAAAGATADDLSKAAHDIGQRVRRVAEAAVTSAFDPARSDQQTSAFDPAHDDQQTSAFDPAHDDQQTTPAKTREN
jgi:hypothetical protein